MIITEHQISNMVEIGSRILILKYERKLRTKKSKLLIQTTWHDGGALLLSFLLHMIRASIDIQTFPV